LRLKLGGGDNGHNGLKSISSALNSNAYYRVRMGIGRPIGDQDPADFVLKPFSKAERETLDQFLQQGVDSILSLVTSGLDVAQSKFNN
jgi:PTH1 family peptidyl-tRNA hydrolase